MIEDQTEETVAKPTAANIGSQIEPAEASVGNNEPDAPLQANNSAPNRKKLLLTALALIIVLAGIFLVLSQIKPTQPKPQILSKVSVRLEWLNGPEFTGMYVAQDKGFYKAVNLDVDIREFKDSTDTPKEVSSGQENFGVSTPLELILARDKGENNKAIAAIMQTSPYAFAVRKDANIKSPSDFKGKILGNIGDNNEAKVTYGVLLANANLKNTDTTIKSIDFDVVKDFQEHQADTADIYRTDQTFLLDQAKVPYDMIYPEQFGFSIYGDVLIASDNQISQHPAQTQAFVSATMKGWQYAIDHESDTLAILAKHNNAFYDVPGYDKYSLEATKPLIETTGNQPIGSMEYVPWNRAFEGVRTAGLLKSNLEVSDIYTSQFIK